MGKSKYQDFLVYDTETGGLPSKEFPAFYGIPLTEVALVMVSPDLEIVGKDSFLISPHYKDGLQYQSKASEVSGITIPMLEKDGISTKEALDRIKDFINSYRSSNTKPTLVGHNIRSFDNPFLENWFEFCKDDLYKLVSKYDIDTLDLCHQIFPEAPNYQLGTMCDQYDIELVKAHRALPDTIGNAELFIEIFKRLRGQVVSSEIVEDNIEYDIIDKINKFQF
tara:strand:+ start:42378 stop:43046 length:669 start_codon:yes stop_codon:yes gene_type:complete